MDLEKPELYRLSEDGRSLVLRAGRCDACDAVLFPLPRFGCPHCGARAEQVRETTMSGRVRLLSAVTIYGKLTPGLVPPVVVGEAEIAPGQIEEIMLAAAEADLAEGMTVAAVPVQVGEGDGARLACRFVPVEGAPWV